MNDTVAGQGPLERQVGRLAPERAEYAGVRCMCVLTGCRAGPGCPHYTDHCKQHIAHANARALAFEQRRCYVCGTRADEGCCGGADGERAECPWY
jgi:hypothetical protein